MLLPHHKSTSGYKYYTEQQLSDFSESYYENCKRNVETDVKEIHSNEIADNELESNSQVEIERQSKAYVAPYHYFGTSRLVRELENISLNELVTVPMGRFGSVDVLMWVDKAMQKKLGLASPDIPEDKLRPTNYDIFIIESILSLKKARVCWQNRTNKKT